MYIAGLVIAIIGFIAGIIPLFGWLAIPFNLIAIAVGVVGVKNKAKIDKGDFKMAVASLILGLLPLIFKIPTIITILGLGSM